MAEVKFVNRVKYAGAYHDAHTSFKVADEDVPALVKAGAIVTVAAKEKKDEPRLNEMKVSELKAYAAELNIDIGKAEKKVDIVAAIREAQAATPSN